MSDTIHFIQVSGRMEANVFKEHLEEGGMTIDDNVVIIDQQVHPIEREEALYFLEEVARTLDVAEEMNIDWEQEYENMELTDS